MTIDQQQQFESIYRTQQPDGTPVADAGWDIGEPQPMLIELDRGGAITGTVLDAGCGTGDNTLYLARHGYTVTGLDAAPSAIAHARTKASQQRVTVEFAVADARELSAYRGRFDTIIDSGLFHIFSNTDQARYLAALHRASHDGARLHVLAISDTAQGTRGPRRLTETEMRAAFAAGWLLDDLQRGTMAGALPGQTQRADIPAWLATAHRR
jgi:2-polyprenyl-3-methyl-5-hydroxy-6-metoxy-1,4-benzoquinol methylase